MSAHAAAPPRAQEALARAIMGRIAEAMVDPARACQSAIYAAELSHHVPSGLLLAISLVESGRPDARGVLHPWPWTINAAGAGSYFNAKAQAVAAVEAKRQQGILSIDVGCMQMNLMQHPEAFDSLDAAFDPVINANRAADFLVSLKRESGDWQAAAGLYHSHNETLAKPYRAAVSARYNGPALTEALAGSFDEPVQMPEQRYLAALSAAWQATIPRVQDADSMPLWPKRPDSNLTQTARLTTRSVP